MLTLSCPACDDRQGKNQGFSIESPRMTVVQKRFAFSDTAQLEEVAFLLFRSFLGDLARAIALSLNSLYGYLDILVIKV